MDTYNINTFTKRMAKIGIAVTYIANYPWIYLDTVNGKKIKEKYEAEHGFTIFWVPVRRDQPVVMSSITEVFKIIRKYK